MASLRHNSAFASFCQASVSAEWRSHKDSWLIQSQLVESWLMSMSMSIVRCLTWLKWPRLLRRPRKRSKGVYRITSGNECWNRNGFRSLRKAETDGADWMSSGRVFQNVEAATGNEWWPTVERRYDGTSSCSVKDDRRRRRPVRLDTGTSWFR